MSCFRHSVFSNCVISLSADKDQVLREAFRVLESSGCFAVPDDPGPIFKQFWIVSLMGFREFMTFAATQYFTSWGQRSALALR